MFGMSFGPEDRDFNAPRLSVEALQEGIRQLRVANDAALDRMCDRTLSLDEHKWAVGESEALHDMITDLGSLLAVYDQHDGLSLAMSVGRVIFGWGQQVEKHVHAHEATKSKGGNDLLSNILAAMRSSEEAHCMPMHRVSAITYRTWAFKLLHQFADSLTANAA